MPLTDRAIVEKIVEFIRAADRAYLDRPDYQRGSDFATERDLNTFDEIVDLLTAENRLGDLLSLR